jgi:hypothetical protein
MKKSRGKVLWWQRPRTNSFFSDLSATANERANSGASAPFHVFKTIQLNQDRKEGEIKLRCDLQAMAIDDGLLNPTGV